jgi:hypothetical protein
MIYDLRLKTIFFLLLVICYLLFVTAPTAQAQTMSNENYILRTENFNTISGVTAGEDYKIRATAGNFSNQSTSEGVNFKVKTGFENIVSELPFSISISSNIIDFGTLSPTNPVIRTVNLTTNSLTAYGYSVLIFENEPLATVPPASKTFIPDTTCDDGACGTENAAQWTNALTYGLGYRCDNVAGADCNNSFAKPNAYKHFPDLASNDDPQSIMSGIGANNKEINISYKVNISGTQAQGTYNNVITYIGIPNF